MGIFGKEKTEDQQITKQFIENEHTVGDSFYPSVSLDFEKGEFSLKGRSVPSDAFAFYEKILDKIKKYVEYPEEKTVFEIHFEYFNTASSKQLLMIFEELDKIYQNFTQKEVLIRWYFDADDEDMQGAGEGYQDLMGNLLFEHIGVE